MDLLAIILIKFIIIDDKSAIYYFYHYCFVSWIDNKEIASVLFSIVFLILWTLVAGILYKKKLFIRL